MDAVTFVREKQRMCNSFGDICEKQCPLRKLCGGCLITDPNADPKDVVEVVEQWSAENPIITNGMQICRLLHEFDDFKETRRSGDRIVLEFDGDWWKEEYKEE